MPALASGRRVVVATATKALQEQLLTKDVPLAAAALGREVNVAVLKGRQNYLCRNRLQGFALLGGSLFARPEDGRAFDAMRDWIDSTETGDRAELEVEPSRGAVVASWRSDPTAASGERAPTSAPASPRRPASGPRTPTS